MFAPAIFYFGVYFYRDIAFCLISVFRLHGFKFEDLDEEVSRPLLDLVRPDKHLILISPFSLVTLLYSPFSFFSDVEGDP